MFTALFRWYLDIYIEENLSPVKKRKLNKKSKPNRVIKVLQEENKQEAKIVNKRQTTKVSNNYVKFNLNKFH